jgi:hypothetical protein
MTTGEIGKRLGRDPSMIVGYIEIMKGNGIGKEKRDSAVC